MFKPCFTFLLLIIMDAAIYSQAVDADSSMQHVLHSLERNNPGVDLQEHINYLYQVSENPVDVNAASLGALLTIPFIDFGTALAMHTYKKDHGPNITAAVLHDSTLFNQTTIELCLPFITFQSLNVSEPVNKPVSKGNRISLFSKNGFSESKRNENLPGSPYYSAHSFRFTDTTGFYASLIFEKDIGELALDDYASFSLKTRVLNESTFIILGNFAFEHGNGLLHSNKQRTLRYRFQQVSAVEAPKFLHPHTGLNSNSALRGIAAITELDNVTLAVYYAYNMYDASRYNVNPELFQRTSSGLHISQTQIAGRHLLRESIFGFSAAKEIGGMYLSALFSLQKVNQRMLMLHQQQSTNFSLSLLTKLYRFNIKSEAAWANKALAASTVLSYSEVSGRSYTVSVISRAKNYFAMHALTESSLPGSGEFIIRTSYHKKTGKKTFGMYGENYHYQFTPYFSEKLAGTIAGIFQSTDSYANAIFLVSCEYGTQTYSVDNLSEESTKFRLFSDSRIRLSKNFSTRFHFGYSGSQANRTNFGGSGLQLGAELHHQLYANLNWSTKVLINTSQPTSGFSLYENEYDSLPEVRSIAITEAFRWVVQVRYKPLQTLHITARFLKRARQNGVFDSYSAEEKEYVLSVSWVI